MRVVHDATGTFHPKIIVGTRGSRGRAIVGSSNFTRAAFDTNHEVNLLISGAAQSGAIEQLLRVVDTHFHMSSAEPLTTALLDAYRPKWDPKPRAKVFRTTRRRQASGVVARDSQLDAAATFGAEAAVLLLAKLIVARLAVLAAREQGEVARPSWPAADARQCPLAAARARSRQHPGNRSPGACAFARAQRLSSSQSKTRCDSIAVAPG
ncbi:phospholipase D-like domain-containing protein [Enhygromyxa salina]|uniref:phospholipase D-like domain-containing protein n=1 Tax=Enhygromyxa salina TaxID=215803 RepID=UPI0013FCF7A4